MKTLRFTFLILLLSSCSKKQLPHFQSNARQNYSTEESIVSKNFEEGELPATQNSPQKPELASVSLNTISFEEDLPKEGQNQEFKEKAAFLPKLSNKKSVKLTQILKIKKSNFEEKPKYEKLGNAASIFGTFALVFILITIFLAFTSEYVLFFWIPTMIFANIALILGLISVKKVVKKQKARFGIFVGLIWDVLLLSFIAWLAVFR